MKTHTKPTQAAVILRHLEKYRKGITTAEAFALYGITRLAARVFELIRAGYCIVTTKEKTAGGATVTRYKLAR